MIAIVMSHDNRNDTNKNKHSKVIIVATNREEEERGSYGRKYGA